MVKARKPPDPYETTLAESLAFMNKRMFKEKRTRQDVADRKANNKDLTCTVVKTTWNSFCKPPAAALDIAGCLFEVNKAILEAYVLANLHVIRMCETQKALPEINQSFFYRCLSAVSAGHRKSPEISELDFRESVEVYTSWRPRGCRAPDSSHLASGWYQQASQQMTTMTKNSVSMNFYRRFRNYLKCRYEMDGKQAYLALNAIKADEYTGDDEIVLRYRALYPSKPKKGQREDYPEVVMALQYRFLQYQQGVHQACQAANKDIPKHCRLFSLIPTKQGFECSHLKMCSNGLQGLLRRSNIDEVEGHKIPTSVTEFRRLAEDLLWEHFFNVEDFETVNRKFAGEILLDGKAVSIVLKKPKSCSPASKQTKLSDFDEIWGLDPGRREVFVASNEQGQVKRLSTKQFYHEAKFKASTKKIQSWHKLNDEVAEAITKLSSKKTSKVADLQNYMRFLFPRLDMLLGFHMQKGYRDLKFRRYVLKQKKLKEICDSFTEKAGRRTLIGFGDWSNKDSAGVIKKSPAAPVKQLERELAKRCKVISIDEFRSSKLHEKCHCELNKTYRQKADKNGVLRRVKIHSVLFCSNRSCNGMRVNRDVNASRNMLALLQQQVRDGSRPEAFRRTLSNEFPTTPTASARAEVGGLSGLVPTGAGLGGRCRAHGNAWQPAAPLLPGITV